MITVIQIDPKNHKQRQLFKRIASVIYANNSQWVPPLAFEAEKVFHPARCSFYDHGEATFLVAMQDGRVVGRLAVLHNEAYNAYNQERKAFFYLFECINDRSVTSELFEKAFTWASERGLTCIEGPKGFSVLDGMGLLVKGFEHRPAFGIPFNLPYYPELIESVGFETHRELLSGYLGTDIHFPEKVIQLAELLKQKKGFSVLDMNSRSELRQGVRRLKDMYNAALVGTSGNAPLTDADLDSMTKGLLWIADPKLIKLILKDDEAVGFLLAYPDISAALQRCRGHLLPFGWLQILIEARRTQWLNINGAGIVEKYRRSGATAILFTELYRSVTSGQFSHADVVQIGTENEAMLLELQKIGVDFYKTHRTYQRAL